MRWLLKTSSSPSKWELWSSHWWTKPFFDVRHLLCWLGSCAASHHADASKSAAATKNWGASFGKLSGQVPEFASIMWETHFVAPGLPEGISEYSPSSESLPPNHWIGKTGSEPPVVASRVKLFKIFLSARLLYQHLAISTGFSIDPSIFVLPAGCDLSTKMASVFQPPPKLHQHRPQTATTHVSTKVMCNSIFLELSGTLLLRKERREKKGDKHRNRSRNQEEPANHDGTEPLSWGKKEERRRETSTGTKEREEGRQAPEPQPEPGIMMEQNPFPEERKKREEGRQAPEPQPEPRGTSKSWWNRTLFLRKERREKKGDKHRNQRREKKGDKHQNPSRNQEEPANHDGTEPFSWGKKEERRRETSTGTKEERRRETSTGTPAGTKRNQQIMMEQNPFPEERKKREEGRQAPEPKKREEGRQAPEPQPEPGGTSKSWWNRTLFLRKERREKKGDKHRNQRREKGDKHRNQRREKKGDKHRNPSRNQEEPANHEGTKAVASKNWEPHSAQELFGQKSS